MSLCTATAASATSASRSNNFSTRGLNRKGPRAQCRCPRERRHENRQTLLHLGVVAGDPIGADVLDTVGRLPREPADRLNGTSHVSSELTDREARLPLAFSSQLDLGALELEHPLLASGHEGPCQTGGRANRRRQQTHDRSVHVYMIADSGEENYAGRHDPTTVMESRGGRLSRYRPIPYARVGVAANSAGSCPFDRNGYV